jgi:hypothetical protein
MIIIINILQIYIKREHEAYLHFSLYFDISISSVIQLENAPEFIYAKFANLQYFQFWGLK